MIFACISNGEVTGQVSWEVKIAMHCGNIPVDIFDIAFTNAMIDSVKKTVKKLQNFVYLLSVDMLNLSNF